MRSYPSDILMADDDEDDRMLFSEALRDICPETKIQFAQNGFDLMQKLEERKAQLPQLILLDINMPQVNGLDCLASIRKSDKLKDIPIAIFSTSNRQDHIEASYKAGADLYIQKPSHFDMLVKIVQDLLSKKWQFHQQPDVKHFFVTL
jgi:CheY-like chemotaxis protein